MSAAPHSGRAPRVVVSGLGFITSIGNDKTEVTRSLRALQHGIAAYEFFPGAEVPVKVAGTIKGFDTRAEHFAHWSWPALYTFSREMLRSLSPHGLHAFCAVEQLIADARLTPELLRDEHTGMFTASAGSPFLQRTILNQMHESAGRRMAPLGVVTTISGTLNFNLAPHYGIRGGVCGFVSACASSAHALGYGFDEITLGRHRRVLVVAGEELTADSVYPFHGLRALSRNPDPATASRPFDRGRDGFVGTGGAAALLLEHADDARARGAPIYAELAGWGQASDGFNMVVTEPEGRGLGLAMGRALTAAQIAPDDVDYVNAHATSTVSGDASEAAALRRLFAPERMRPAISSTKALTGHALSFAAVMETGFCALALAEGFTPGQAHLAEPDPACAGLHLPRSTTAAAPDVVLKNSCGFGGSNVALVLRRWRD